MNKLRKFLSQIIVAVMAIFLVMPGAIADTNFQNFGDIGDFGTWATQHNREVIINDLHRDLEQFQGNVTQQLVPDAVPIEAKIGFAFMQALSLIGKVLDSSLVRFVIIFLILAYIFWIVFELYEMMTKGSSPLKLGETVVKKALVLAIWIVILNMGAARLFMWIMGPVLTIGTYVSDLILNAVANTAGTEIPNTCAAIKNYIATKADTNLLINIENTSDILCLATRLTGFFYTAIAAGWKWLAAGIGTSAFTSLVGGAFIYLFIQAGFKFAFMALGVIADLFLAVLMLPFVAISETLPKTSYKGIPGQIFNGLLGLFKNMGSLQSNILKFINVTIYFISLSIVIAVCAALLSGVVDSDLAAQTPTLNNIGFIPTLLTGLLVMYLAENAEKIAGQIGGKIDASIGTNLQKDTVQLWKNAQSKYKEWKKLIKGS